MQLTSHSPSFTIGLRAICPFFHYSVPASCIVTTTNFLAVYKAVNQNHTEQGVEVGGRRGGAGWAVGEGCKTLDQMSEFYTAGQRQKGGRGRRNGSGLAV